MRYKLVTYSPYKSTSKADSADIPAEGLQGIYHADPDDCPQCVLLVQQYHENVTHTEGTSRNNSCGLRGWCCWASCQF